MNVTEVERKESSSHCCGNGCCRRDSAEHEEKGRALIDQRITENNSANADRRGYGMLEEIVSAGNQNRAYKRVRKNKGAGGIDGMKVDELLLYLRENGEEIRQTILAGRYQPKPVRRVEIPKDNGKTRKLGIPTAADRVIQQAIAQVLTPIYKLQTGILVHGKHLYEFLIKQPKPFYQTAVSQSAAKPQKTKSIRFLAAVSGMSHKRHDKMAKGHFIKN